MPLARRKLFAVIAIAIAAAGMSTRADALKTSMLYGKWCSDIGTLEFTADLFTVTLAADQKRGVYKICNYEVRAADITAHWTGTTHANAMTRYGGFSTDGSRMVQLPVPGSQARVEFHRC